MALAKDEFARRVRAARVRSGQSQTAAADAAGLSLRNYQRYESGEIMPRATAMPRLANALGIPIEHLEEPARETVLERVERKIDENAQLLRQTLGLIDTVLARVDTNRANLEAATQRVTGRIDDLEAQVQTQGVELNRVQRDFLQALGAAVPPPATDAPERESGKGSTLTLDTPIANG